MVILFWRQERAAVEHGMRETARALVVDVDRELESSLMAMEVFATTKALDTDSRELMTTALERCGVHVTAVASVGEALTTLELATPDVVISDIAMPGEDGYALIEKIRSREADSGLCLPAVALTAHARDEDRARALAAGYQMHVTKPVDPAALAHAVESLATRVRAA